MVALALLVGMGAEHPIQVGHNEILALDSSVNRVAVIGDSYTTGSDLGGLGPKGWTARAWRELAAQRTRSQRTWAPRAGRGTAPAGNRGSVFEDLTARTVKPDDVLVVFFGSRNDQGVDPAQLSVLAYGTFQLARRMAPAATVPGDRAAVADSRPSCGRGANP